MTCRLRWCVEMETRCRIPILRTFGRIQWHVISEPRITLQGAATWWIHCHDSRATCYITGCSHLTKSISWSCHIAGCKNSTRHFEFSPYFIFLFLMQFRLWRAAAFVSSPTHLLLLAFRTPPDEHVLCGNSETYVRLMGCHVRLSSLLAVFTNLQQITPCGSFYLVTFEEQLTVSVNRGIPGRYYLQTAQCCIMT